jgi:hypothetical protein
MAAAVRPHWPAPRTTKAVQSSEVEISTAAATHRDATVAGQAQCACLPSAVVLSVTPSGSNASKESSDSWMQASVCKE